MTQAAVADPQEGKQGRHRKGCYCSTHLAQNGLQHVVPQTITQEEAAPMATYNMEIIKALAGNAEALQSYLDSINGNDAPATAEPITQAVSPPVAPVAPVALPLVSRIEIPVAVELPTGKAKWGKLLDQRQHGPKWNVDTDDIRFANDKVFVSPKRVDLTKRVRIVFENY